MASRAAMLNRSSPMTILLVSLLICVSSLAWCSGVPVEKLGFSYGDVPNGPQFWQNLSSDWWPCGVGKSQSPIQIYKKEHTIVKMNRTLKLSYKSGNASFRLHNHQVGVQWTEDAGSVHWEGEEYKLLQFHTHFPSEHILKKERFPMEMHLVHKAPNGKLLVIGLLYRYGKQSSFLEKLVQELPSFINGGKKEYYLENLSVSSIKFGEMYYRYTGSLTTPPCTEGVTWIIMKKKHNLSKAQAGVIRTTQGGDNSRPLQALNGRTIYRNH